ncbi:transposase [Siccirubricoccus deserti]
MRTLSKSALRVAGEALAVGRTALPAYGSHYSRHDYTQPQLFALLVLKQFLRTDYRGLVAAVAEWQELRQVLGLRKVPHYSTLAYAAHRLLAGAEKGDLPARSGRGRRPCPCSGPDRCCTGGGRGCDRARDPACQHLLRPAPRGSGHRQRAWPKLTAVVHTHSHLILGAVPGVGPSQDSPDFAPVVRQATALLAFKAALADAAYDAEHNHRLCREECGMRRSVIALNSRNAGRRWPKTPHRRAMRRHFPRALYHQRWHAESGFSQHKRRLGSALSARSGAAQAREIILRVLTHNLMLLRSPTTGFQQCNMNAKESCEVGMMGRVAWWQRLASAPGPHLCHAPACRRGAHNDLTPNAERRAACRARAAGPGR